MFIINIYIYIYKMPGRINSRRNNRKLRRNTKSKMRRNSFIKRD